MFCCFFFLLNCRENIPELTFDNERITCTLTHSKHLFHNFSLSNKGNELHEILIDHSDIKVFFFRSAENINIMPVSVCQCNNFDPMHFERRQKTVDATPI